MKKRFIVLIDFSDYSEDLLKYAYDWSLKIDAEILLVHKNNVLVPSLIDNQIRNSLIISSNSQTIDKLKELSAKVIPDNVNISYSVSDNDLKTILDHHLSEEYENLIFTGLKGTGVLKKIFIGSTTIKIIEKINNIIVAIPKNIVTISQKNIFVGVTDKYPINVIELNKFLNSYFSKDINLTFFYLAKNDEDTSLIEKTLRDLSNFFSEKYNTSFSLYKGEPSFLDIKKIVTEESDDLLIIQKGSRLLKDQLFRSFLINELVYEGRTPLVVLP